MRYWWTLTIYASQHVTSMSGPGSVQPFSIEGGESRFSPL